MDIVIREIAGSDAREITELTNQLGYTIQEDEMLHHITAVQKHGDCDALVAVHEKQVIGWIGLARRIQLESAPFCEINGLVVREGYRGRGVGKLLIEKAKNWSIDKGCNHLRLRTNIKRHDAHRFYSALGFHEIKQQKVFEIEF